MSKSLLFTSRVWHRQIASVLFIFFFVIALTGLMLGWKSLFTKTIFENHQVTPEKNMSKWLPLDALEKKAAIALADQLHEPVSSADRVDIRPAKGYISFLFRKKYYVQVNGATGEAATIELRYGGLIQDIHDGAIADNLFGGHSGAAKTVYTTILSLSLLLLTISGFYLWYKPKQIRQSKKQTYYET